MSPTFSMILGIILISSAAALGAVGTYIFKSGWEESQKIKSQYRGEERNIALEIFEITKSDPREMTTDRTVKLRIKNTSGKELTNLRLVRARADGPKDLNRISAPEILRTPTKLNPQDYFEFELAEYREQPPSKNIGLHIGSEPSIGYHGFDANVPVQYSFFVTAAESLSAEIAVDIWVENGKLRYK